MILLQYKENVIRFLVFSVLLIIIMLILSKVFYSSSSNMVFNEVFTSKIEFNDENTSVYAEYPRFNENDEVNKLITDNLYKYIRDFRNNSSNKALDITYNLFYIDNIVNIQYHIENTLDDIKNKNLLIDLDTNKITYISSLYDEEKLYNEISNELDLKYEDKIKTSILNNTINNYTYIFDDSALYVYFNDFNNAYITIDLNPKYHNNDNNVSGKKYIAFTYDDGPSENTSDLIDYLESVNSSATFFMIGNKMKTNESIIKKVYESNSEVASHGFTHKRLDLQSIEELESELNSTNIIYNEITGDNIDYLRPPYGKYNDNVLLEPYKVITWNIDPKDWMLKDKNKIYNNVIKNACDGCIVLMHDTYKESIEATKMLIPKLNSLGYEVVSISKLMEVKNYYSDEYEAISFIK